MNTPKTLTPSWELVPISIDLVKKYFEAIIYLLLLPVLLLTLGRLLMGPDFVNQIHYLSDRQKTGLAVSLIGLTRVLINLGPSLYFIVKTSSGKDSNIREAYRKGLPFFWRLLGLNLIVSISMIVGLILFIVPGVIVIQRYYLAQYFLVKDNLSIIQALKTSEQQSAPYYARTWGVIGVQVVIVIAANVIASFLGPVGLIVGQFIAISTLYITALRFNEVRQAGGKTSA